MDITNFTNFKDHFPKIDQALGQYVFSSLLHIIINTFFDTLKLEIRMFPDEFKIAFRVFQQIQIIICHSIKNCDFKKF